MLVILSWMDAVFEHYHLHASMECLAISTRRLRFVRKEVEINGREMCELWFWRVLQPAASLGRSPEKLATNQN